MKEIFEKHPNSIFKVIFKYGADGSTNHSEYQHHDPEADENVDQDSLFVSYLSIIQIKAILPDDSTITVYQSKMYNSPFGMVPLRFRFEKETKENNLSLCFSKSSPSQLNYFIHFFMICEIS